MRKKAKKEIKKAPRTGNRSQAGGGMTKRLHVSGRGQGTQDAQSDIGGRWNVTI